MTTLLSKQPSKLEEEKGLFDEALRWVSQHSIESIILFVFS
jgi:hypothetical protein